MGPSNVSGLLLPTSWTLSASPGLIAFAASYVQIDSLSSTPVHLSICLMLLLSYRDGLYILFVTFFITLIDVAAEGRITI